MLGKATVGVSADVVVDMAFVSVKAFSCVTLCVSLLLLLFLLLLDATAAQSEHLLCILKITRRLQETKACREERMFGSSQTWGKSLVRLD